MMACGLLVVPSAVLKAVLPVMLTAGWVPVADSVTGVVPETSGSLLDTCSAPVALPGLADLKATLIVQLCPFVSEAPAQPLLATEKPVPIVLTAPTTSDPCPM